MKNCETCLRTEFIKTLKIERFTEGLLPEQENWCVKCLSELNKPYWLTLDEPKMDIHTARLVREIKKSCTYRKFAEIYYPEWYLGHGNQLTGIYLCRDALKIIYPNDDVWMMYKPKKKFGEKWHKENLSYIGDFYWWE